MDGQTDIRDLGLHLDRERRLADQVAGMRPDDADADDAMRDFVL